MTGCHLNSNYTNKTKDAYLLLMHPAQVLWRNTAKTFGVNIKHHFKVFQLNKFLTRPVWNPEVNSNGWKEALLNWIITNLLIHMWLNIIFNTGGNEWSWLIIILSEDESRTTYEEYLRLSKVGWGRVFRIIKKS